MLLVFNAYLRPSTKWARFFCRSLHDSAGVHLDLATGTDRRCHIV